MSWLHRATRVRQAERIAARVVDGTAVVIVIDEQTVHSLNAVGTHIWELADGRQLGEIANSLVEEFEVEESRAWADLCTFVTDLLELGAIQVDAESKAIEVDGT